MKSRQSFPALIIHHLDHLIAHHALCQHAVAYQLAQGILAHMVSDEQLMMQYRNGDHDAFDTLYAKYRKDLYRFLLRQYEPAIADELYQDIWLKLINASDRYTDTSSFRTWIYTIAHNHLRDHWRRHKTRREDLDNEATDMVLDHRNPEAVTRDRQAIETLLEGVRLLPGEQRQAFLLNVESGLSVDEIAEVTQSSTESTKSRLRYAMKKLREHLKGIWP